MKKLRRLYMYYVLLSLIVLIVCLAAVLLPRKQLVLIPQHTTAYTASPVLGIPPENISRKQNHELVDSDLLPLCSYDHLESNTTTNDLYRTVKNSFHVLRDFIPETFSPKFRNPCWYTKRHYGKSNACTNMPLFSGQELVSANKNLERVTQSENLYCLPSFFLAGFPKCATTTLYKLIIQHPQIVAPECKGSHFWTSFIGRNGTRVTRGAETQWYLTHFNSFARQIQTSSRGKSATPLNYVSPSRQITLDASVSTLWRYNFNSMSDADICLVPSLLRHILPDAKFIVIMREPVKRLFSDYWYVFSTYIEPTWKSRKYNSTYYKLNAKNMFHNSIVKAINMFNSCIDSGGSWFHCVYKFNISIPLRLGAGMYYYHIAAWLNVFPRSQFLFLRMEDLASAPNVVMKRVWRFLHLRSDVVDTQPMSVNVNSWIKSQKYKSSFEMLPETRKLLHAFYQPHNELLAQLLSDSKYLWQ